MNLICLNVERNQRARVLSRSNSSREDEDQGGGGGQQGVEGGGGGQQGEDAGGGEAPRLLGRDRPAQGHVDKSSENWFRGGGIRSWGCVLTNVWEAGAD